MKEGILDLADGRKLAYAEWGPPDAPAVFYCHGFPGNRRELELAIPVMERSGLQVRVVALNRPGYGASTFQARRSFLDWPRDVAESADRLGIDGFSVLGASGGSPCALACGYVLGERVTRIGIVGGSAPIEATGMKDTPMISGVSPNRLVRRIQYELAAFAVGRGREDRFLGQSISMMGDADREAMERPEVRNWFLRVTQEAFSQGGRGTAYESNLYRQDWGFDLSAVTQETSLWYGGADRWAPATAGRWLADRLPNSKFVIWPQHGHFTWVMSFEVAEVVATTAGVK